MFPKGLIRQNHKALLDPMFSKTLILVKSVFAQTYPKPRVLLSLVVEFCL